MKPANSNRPFEGQALKDILRELAEVNTVSMALKFSLDPLSDEDIAAGAEELTPEQIKEDLDQISNIVTRIVLNNLKAEASEWYAANDEIA